MEMLSLLKARDSSSGSGSSSSSSSSSGSSSRVVVVVVVVVVAFCRRCSWCIEVHCFFFELPTLL